MPPRCTGQLPASVSRSAARVGRPNDDLLDILLNHGAEPAQAFIGGREQGLEKGDVVEDRPPGEEPTVPEQ